MGLVHPSEWSTSTVLLVVFGVLAINHAVFAFMRLVLGRSGYSYVPVVNGIVGAVGALLSDSAFLHRFWWLAFVLDWGSIPHVIELLVYRRRNAARS